MARVLHKKWVRARASLKQTDRLTKQIDAVRPPVSTSQSYEALADWSIDDVQRRRPNGTDAKWNSIPNREARRRAGRDYRSRCNAGDTGRPLCVDRRTCLGARRP